MQGKWLSERNMIIRLLAADISTCRSKDSDGVEKERMYDIVVACTGLKTPNREVEVVDDYDSRPQ